jgi:hypothetical protein
MSFLAYFESKINIVFNLRFSVIPRICQSSVGRQSCHSLYRDGVEEWLEREIGVEVNVKEAFKINKDKMMLAKIE